MKGKCEPNNKMYVHPEDVQVPLPTTASMLCNEMHNDDRYYYMIVYLSV